MPLVRVRRFVRSLRIKLRSRYTSTRSSHSLRATRGMPRNAVVNIMRIIGEARRAGKRRYRRGHDNTMIPIKV